MQSLTLVEERFAIKKFLLNKCNCGSYQFYLYVGSMKSSINNFLKQKALRKIPDHDAQLSGIAYVVLHAWRWGINFRTGFK